MDTSPIKEEEAATAAAGGANEKEICNLISIESNIQTDRESYKRHFDYGFPIQTR